MKKITLLVLAVLYAAVSFNSCKSTSKTNKTVVLETQKDTKVLQNNTIIAKFVKVEMSDIVATIIFEKKDGTQTAFYRNVMVPQDPELKYDLINAEGNGANKSLLGQTFEVTYKLDPEGKINEKGDLVPANIILYLQKK